MRTLTNDDIQQVAGGSNFNVMDAVVSLLVLNVGLGLYNLYCIADVAYFANKVGLVTLFQEIQLSSLPGYAKIDDVSEADVHQFFMNYQ